MTVTAHAGPFVVSCSWENCTKTVEVWGAGPTAVADYLIEQGWTFPPDEEPDVLSSRGERHCPTHRQDGPWSNEAASYRALCHTCGEEWESTLDNCREWQDEHECEPDVSVRKIEREKGRTTR